MSPDRWATFDCYGTLIDWLGGIRGTLADLWPDADADALSARYHRIEPTVQAGRGIPYRTVMAETLAQVADDEGLVDPGRDARTRSGRRCRRGRRSPTCATR